MIQEQLQQEILTRIDKLAEKLGVTAEYLWPHLVRYEVASGISTIVASVVVTALTILVWWGFSKTDCDSCFEFVTGACGIILSVTAIILIVVTLTTGIPSIIVPEAAAFKALLP